MRNTALGVLICAGIAGGVAPSFGQSLSTSVDVHAASVGGNPIPVCTDAGTDTVSCSGNWVGGNGSGSGSAAAHAAYGLLQGGVSANLTTTLGTEATSSSAQAIFGDTLTFPALTTAAYLKATLSLSGTSSGNVSAAQVGANLQLDDGYTNPGCSIQTFKGGCTALMAVFPGDIVSVYALLGIAVEADVPLNTAGSTSGALNYDGRKWGAQYSFVLVNAKGVAIKGVPIISASGTSYPTK